MIPDPLVLAKEKQRAARQELEYTWTRQYKQSRARLSRLTIIWGLAFFAVLAVLAYWLGR